MIAAYSGPLPENRRIPALVERGKATAPALVEVVETALVEHQWIAGEEFTAADIMITFGMMIADHLGYVNKETPRFRAYPQLAVLRPAFQRAIVL